MTKEQELQQLKQEYEQRRAALEQGTPDNAGESAAEAAPVPSEHETLSQVVEGAIKQHVPAFQAPSQATHDDAVLSPEQQETIQSWVNVAFAVRVEVTLVDVATVGSSVGSAAAPGVAVITTVTTTGAKVGAAVGRGAVPQPRMAPPKMITLMRTNFCFK